jgi:hypothetical protein
VRVLGVDNLNPLKVLDLCELSLGSNKIVRLIMRQIARVLDVVNLNRLTLLNLVVVRFLDI